MEPNTVARQLVLAKAKGHGGRFHVTNGAHMTCDDLFIAVKATKDTKESSSGALMTKDGSRQLSTISQGTRFQLFNTSEDCPKRLARGREEWLE